ncbi:class I SAM-dependent methyltransferase [Hansschlegelia sp. KR7-227]|uniref:class I SAM-dependent methyltransferase n=1 Tax=Hansschlegelia sp. KR7-227 TaxID=3400914 RepID=UPI003BFECEBB
MSDSGFLHKYALAGGPKRMSKWMHYFDIYERHFSRFRGKRPVILEIGVHGGGSVEMWKAYFGEGAQIVGLDINPDCAQHSAEGIDVFIGSQDDPAVINDILAKHPKIDIVLDDGSHHMRHVMATFKLLFDRISKSGVYMVEDMHTAYWDEYGGGLKREGSFMEFVKGCLDELNATHSRKAVPITGITTSTDSITCYDSVVVFEKRPQSQKQTIIMTPLA